MPEPPESPPIMVERIFKNLDLVDETWECPPRSNELTQKDGWSCGLWSIRWIERSLRERRGEGRSPPPSLKALLDRGNQFIEKIKEAGLSEDIRAEAKAKAKARGKAKAEAKAEAKKRAQRRAMKTPKQIEPAFAGFRGGSRGSQDLQ